MAYKNALESIKKRLFNQLLSNKRVFGINAFLMIFIAVFFFSETYYVLFLLVFLLNVLLKCVQNNTSKILIKSFFSIKKIAWKFHFSIFLYIKNLQWEKQQNILYYCYIFYIWKEKTVYINQIFTIFLFVDWHRDLKSEQSAN